MEAQKIVSGTTEEEIWQQLATDINEDILEYQAVIQQGDRKIILDIDIDPGGGFESGYATTRFASPITRNKTFNLQMYRQTLFAEAGKLFGMEDVETGFADIDKRFIIKTDNEDLVKQIFSAYEVRKLFESENDLELNTVIEKNGEEEMRMLELVLEDGITNIETLRAIYSTFYKIVTTVDLGS